MQALLTAGSRYLAVRRHLLAQTADGDQREVRSQFGVVFNWVVDKGLHGSKGAEQLKADAVSERGHGRPQLIEFVREQRNCLQDQLDFCWELSRAGERIERMSKSRLELILEVALSPEAVCQNANRQCAVAYEQILNYQGIDSYEFHQCVFEAIQFWRRKGHAFMIVGPRDTGKTTVVEVLASILKCMATPQSDSFCSLQDIRGHEAFLWHDFRYSPGNPRDKEQGLRWMKARGTDGWKVSRR